MSYKISDKDKKDWENFLSNKETLHDKELSTNVDKTKISKTLGMGFVDKPMSEIQFPNRQNNFVRLQSAGVAIGLLSMSANQLQCHGKHGFCSFRPNRKHFFFNVKTSFEKNP